MGSRAEKAVRTAQRHTATPRLGPQRSSARRHVAHRVLSSSKLPSCIPKSTQCTQWNFTMYILLEHPQNGRQRLGPHRGLLLAGAAAASASACATRGLACSLVRRPCRPAARLAAVSAQRLGRDRRRHNVNGRRMHHQCTGKAQPPYRSHRTAHLTLRHAEQSRSSRLLAPQCAHVSRDTSTTLLWASLGGTGRSRRSCHWRASAASWAATAARIQLVGGKPRWAFSGDARNGGSAALHAT